MGSEPPRSGPSHEEPPRLGRPWLHLRSTDSTNERARALALAGAPHGTLVTAEAQTAGRGRQGRVWVAPPGSALLCSLLLREPPPLLPLIAGVAVCDAVGETARVKWPNDVVFERGPALAKLAGILVEGRPQEKWAVLGIGVNVAVRLGELPEEVHRRAASLEREPEQVRAFMEDLLEALSARLAEPQAPLLDAWRARDALLGRDISWGASGESQSGTLPEHGLAEGVDEQGALLVRKSTDGALVKLNAGEVHLEPIGS